MSGAQAKAGLVKTALFLFTLIFSLISLAQESIQPVRLLLAYGDEMRPEKDLNSDFKTHDLRNYAIGAGFDSYLVVLERATFEEASGNATLNVNRRLEDTMLWGQWRALQWNHLVPYLGVGAGAYKEVIKTEFAGVSPVTNESDLKLLMGASFGVSVQVPLLWLSLEGRLFFGDELDQQPTFGGLARIGFWL